MNRGHLHFLLCDVERGSQWWSHINLFVKLYFYADFIVIMDNTFYWTGKYLFYSFKNESSALSCSITCLLITSIWKRFFNFRPKWIITSKEYSKTSAACRPTTIFLSCLWAMNHYFVWKFEPCVKNHCSSNIVLQCKMNHSDQTYSFYIEIVLSSNSYTVSQWISFHYFHTENDQMSHDNLL